VRVSAHDQAFVSAPPEAVYERLADLSSHPKWWPGLRTTPRGNRHRPGVGLFVELGEPYRGTVEWYLEPFQDGTVVNCIVDLDLPGGARASARRLRGIRSGIRRKLVGLEEAAR
jgi:hypothetical protein